VQVARAVHALHPDQLDVAGGGGAGDQGVGPGRVEAGERVSQVRGDLVLAHDDQVEVGDQGERAAALTRSAGTVIQDDRAGLGDRHRAAGQHAGGPVEFGRRERGLVAGQRDLAGQAGQPAGRQSVRHQDGTRRGGDARGQHAGDGRGEGGGPGHPLDHGAVVGGAFGEEGGDVVSGGVVVGAQVPAGQRRVRRVGVAVALLRPGRSAVTADLDRVGGADPGQDLVS
jgi:hypothetical protein